MPLLLAQENRTVLYNTRPSLPMYSHCNEAQPLLIRKPVSLQILVLADPSQRAKLKFLTVSHAHAHDRASDILNV